MCGQIAASSAQVECARETGPDHEGAQVADVDIKTRELAGLVAFIQTFEQLNSQISRGAKAIWGGHQIPMSRRL
ncbi:MAG: hypothetical protein ACI8XD_000783 [Thermoproteota archaeon]